MDNSGKCSQCRQPVTLTKTVNNSTVLVGQPVTFTITATNHTLCSISDVIITDFLPKFINIVVPPGCILRDQTVICVLDDLPVGNTVIIITATPTILGMFTNKAILKFKQDPCSESFKCLNASVVIIVSPLMLLISKTATPSTVSSGNAVVFNITVTNPNPISVSIDNIIITDPISLGFTIISTSACSTIGNLVTCNVGTLPPEASTNITITATAPNTAGTFINTVTATFTVNGSVFSVSDSATVTVLPVILLTIDKIATPSTVSSGGTVVFRVNVTNPGSAPINNIIVTDPVPSGFIVNNTSACSVTGNLVTCNVGTLPPGGSSSIMITTTAPNTPGAFINTATATFTINGSVFNVSDSDTVIVSAPSQQLQISKGIIPLSAIIGFNVAFLIDIMNPGLGPINNIVITDQIPANFNNIQAEGCTIVGNLVTCNIGTLESGNISNITITGDAVTTGNYTNIATATYTINGIPQTSSSTASGSIVDI